MSKAKPTQPQGQPHGDIQLYWPTVTKIKLPKGLRLPTYKNSAPISHYREDLDKRACKFESDDEPEKAAYVFALLFQLTHQAYPDGSVKSLYSLVKLARCLYDDRKTALSATLAKEALVFAKKLQNTSKEDKLFHFSVTLLAHTIPFISNRYYNNDTIQDVEEAGSILEHGVTYLTKLLGADNALTKLCMNNLGLAEQKINYLKELSGETAKASGSPEIPNPNEQSMVDSEDKSKQQRNKKDSTSKRSTATNLGKSEPSTENKASPPSKDDTAPKQTSLEVPNVDKTKGKRSQSTGRKKGTETEQSSTVGEDRSARPRSLSDSAATDQTGQLFDGSAEKSISTDPFTWSGLYSSTQKRSVSVLEKTHQELKAWRGSYPLGDDKDTRRVRIAVIDTGIDMDRIAKKRKKQIKAHCTVPGIKEAKEDKDGHGTNIVLLLLDICPEAEIYVYRAYLHKYDVRIDGIVPALQRAIYDDVDIINISFGFQNSHPAMAKEIKNATSKEILVFAAVSNTGAANKLAIAWPAIRGDVFSISAANHECKIWEHNPPPEEDSPNFSTFGERIRPTQAPSDSDTLIGTSFASPIAAATAALFLDFARIPPTDNDPPIELFQYIHEFDSMKALLLASSVDTKDRFHFIKPWLIFHRNNWSRTAIGVQMKLALQKVHGY